MQITMLQDPISKPPDVTMEIPRSGTTSDHRRNKPNGGGAEQVLKCPRCDSLNTKFCYYNNYSLTQPRHFCKNCRRYWTQGGSLRNVPIGGGCRKNKRVKQRTVDSHLFGGMEDHSGPGSFLMQQSGTNGAASTLLSSSCFVGGPPGTSIPPAYADLLPTTNDSHLLNVAFSRLQESFRLGTHEQSCALPLSLMHLTPSLYENAALVGNNYVKPDHHHVFNGSDQVGSNLFEHQVAASSAAHLGSSSASVGGGGGVGGLPPSLDHEQLANFGVPDAFGSQLDAQLKMQQHRAHAQLALHLGGGGGSAAGPSEHHMPNPESCSTMGAPSCAVMENNRGVSGSQTERYLDVFHHRHHALPGFEDQESPESMQGSMMRRSAGHQHAPNKQQVQQQLPVRSCMSNMDNMVEDRAAPLAAAEGWQHVTNSTHDQHQAHIELGPRADAPAATYNHHHHHHHHHHTEVQQVTAASASAGEQAQISFWSPSPWSASNPDLHSGALL